MMQYVRPEMENYGLSTVELVELDMSDNPLNVINVDGKEVYLPVLNLKKYGNDYHCYAFIERMKQRPVTMVDLLYSYKPISFDDPDFRDKFLREFSRTQINRSTMNLPGIFYGDKKDSQANAFKGAVKSAVSDAYKTKIFTAKNSIESQLEIEKPRDPSKINDDNLLLEMARTLYEMITFTKIKRPSDPIIKKVDFSILKDLMFMKNGEIIIRGSSISKYFSMFRTQSITSEHVDEIPEGTMLNRFSFYINGVDDRKLSSDQNYLQSFENTILQSHILEALSVVNSNRLPNFLYAGNFNNREGRIEVNEAISKYFINLNELMFLAKNKDER